MTWLLHCISFLSIRHYSGLNWQVWPQILTNCARCVKVAKRERERKEKKQVVETTCRYPPGCSHVVDVWWQLAQERVVCRQLHCTQTCFVLRTQKPCLRVCTESQQHLRATVGAVSCFERYTDIYYNIFYSYLSPAGEHRLHRARYDGIARAQLTYFVSLPTSLPLRSTFLLCGRGAVTMQIYQLVIGCDGHVGGSTWTRGTRERVRSPSST